MNAILTPVISLVLSLIVATTAQAQDFTPDVLIKTVTDELLEIVRKDKVVPPGNSKEIVAMVDSKVNPYFDFKRMTMLALGRDWRQATETQQNILTGEFRILLVRTYLKVLTDYRKQAISFEPLSLKAGETDVRVRAEIEGSGSDKNIEMNHYLAKAGPVWKVYDIEIAGVSLVTTYRASFSSEVKGNGIDGLIRSLQAKNAAANSIQAKQVSGSGRDVSDARSRAPSQTAQTSTASNATSPSRTQSQQTGSQGGTTFQNLVGFVYGNDKLLAMPYIVSSGSMLQSLVAVMGKDLPFKIYSEQACREGAADGPYVGFVHYSTYEYGPSMGISCGSKTPEEAFRGAQSWCERGGGRCRVESGGPEFTRTIVILDRSIAVGKPNYADENEILITRERTSVYQPGQSVSHTMKFGFSEGYVCTWRRGRNNYEREFQMTYNGVFTKVDARSAKGRYDFNCGSKH